MTTNTLRGFEWRGRLTYLAKAEGRKKGLVDHGITIGATGPRETFHRNPRIRFVNTLGSRVFGIYGVRSFSLFGGRKNSRLDEHGVMYVFCCAILCGKKLNPEANNLPDFRHFVLGTFSLGIVHCSGFLKFSERRMYSYN